MKENYCVTCGRGFEPGDVSVRCSLCLHNYHASCWEQAGGCTTYGCSGKVAGGGNGRTLPVKPCPFCGERVATFAVRCRYCQASLEPDDRRLRREESDRKNGSSTSDLRKDPILTGLLNLIFPGAGYMYLGQFNKGLLWFLAAFAAWFFTRWVGFLLVYFYIIYDSTRQAVAFNRGGLPPSQPGRARRQ